MDNNMERPKEKEIIIIGGGIAGLAAGIYARQQGDDYRTTIIEMDSHAGGQLTAWHREGYTFDYCLQWLVGSRHGTAHDILREIGAINDDTEVINHDVFVKMVHETHGDFFFYSDLDRWEQYLLEMAPEDSKGIRKLCKMMKKAGTMSGDFENPPEMRSAWDYLKLVLKNWRALPLVARYAKRTNVNLLDDLKLKNAKLRFFLEKFPTDFGHEMPGDMLMLILGWQHDKNAGYLRGGSASMAQRIVDTSTKLGGQFKLGSKVEKIIVEDDVVKGVVLDNGEKLFADHVITACDGHTVLYDMLEGKYLPPELKEAYENYETFEPLVMASFGIDKTIESDAHAIDYLGEIQIGRTTAKLVEVLNRSMYDDTLAPKGKSTLELYFQSPWDIWKDISDIDYAKEKEAIEKDALEFLEKQYPGVSEHVEVVDIATPQTTVKYTGVWKGAFEGFLPNVGVVGSTLPMDLKGLGNFTMVGQWVMPGK